MPNTNNGLVNAKKGKNDEFYTRYEDIQTEVNYYLEYDPDTFKDKVVLLPCDDPEWSNFTKFFAQNFEMLGLKKLISTSYATDSKNKYSEGYQFSVEDFLTDFEQKSPQYDAEKSPKHGKIFTLTRRNKKIDINDLEWSYLKGDGDFRSDEVKKLRDEADIIVTNPPFSLFRTFVAWIMEANKKCLIIGHQNAITYKEVFPLIRDNRLWLGKGFNRNCTHFINVTYKDTATDLDHREGMIRVAGVMWFTNIDHGRRHQPYQLMTMAENLKFSKHKDIKEKGYRKYENYDVIEVPHSDAIPSDYDGVMGVPVTFMTKFCPEQFELIGMAEDNGKGFSGEASNWDGVNPHCVIDGDNKYKRIFIRKRRAE